MDDGGASSPEDAGPPPLPLLAAQCGVTVPMPEDRCPSFDGPGVTRCEPLGATCSRFVFATDDLAMPQSACMARCVALEGDPFWSETSCARCTRACVPPGPQSVVHELDTLDCLARPITACADGFSTRQDAFDATLVRLLPPASGALSELIEISLQVEVKDGCVTRFYTPLGSLPLTRVQTVLGPALADARFDCAEALACGQIVGPMTLP